MKNLATSFNKKYSYFLRKTRERNSIKQETRQISSHKNYAITKYMHYDCRLFFKFIYPSKQFFGIKPNI